MNAPAPRRNDPLSLRKRIALQGMPWEARSRAVRLRARNRRIRRRHAGLPPGAERERHRALRRGARGRSGQTRSRRTSRAMRYAAWGASRKACRSSSARCARSRAIPTSTATWASSAYVLGELPEAIRSLQRAIELAPTLAEPYGNLSMALRDSGEFERALAAARHAVQLRPDLAAARLNLAWPCWRSEITTRRGAPMWAPRPHGEPARPGSPGVIAHASVLPSLDRDPWITLHGEQGVGDVIFFLRFARALRERGAKLRFWATSGSRPCC